MKAWTVVGYTYAADEYCTSCMEDLAADAVAQLDPERIIFPIGEDVIRLWARLRGIDYANESSYDSGDFPKVIFADMVESDDEYCGCCHRPLLD